MAQPSATKALADTVQDLAKPFDSPEDLRVLGAKLDAIVGALVRTAYAASRVARNSTVDPTRHIELPDLLRAIGGDAFRSVAASAEELLNFSRASIVDFGLAADDVQLANTARERFYTEFSDLLRKIDFG
jgi:hypothetical protein